MLVLQRPATLRRRAVSAAVSLILFMTLVVYTFRDPARGPCCSGIPKWSPSSSSASPTLDVLSLPELDEPPLLPPSEHAAFCDKRFTAAYLEDLRDHSIQYCDPVDNIPPQSRLTCFHAHARSDNGVDSFCFGSGATWDARQKKFRLDCPVRRRPDANETARGLIPFESIVASWYDTGPRPVFDKFVAFAPGEEGAPQKQQQILKEGAPHEDSRSFVLLVKREGSNNLWHNLMQVSSMMMSVDVLRIARQQDDGRGGRGGGGAPFFRFPEDLDNTHVVVVDDYAEEPTFDLWRLFSRHPIVKLQDMIDDPSHVPLQLQQAGAAANIIVPLSGGSNPLWQNDWLVRDCREAPLVKLFARRIFDHYQVPMKVGPRPTAEGEEQDIVVTFIDRRGSRQLLGHAALFQKLQKRYPNVVVQSVDFATLALPDQLRLVQATDVLVGVHGAGLTHTMFMRENAGAVVEIQPEKLGHKGFRNLAAMTGQKYFSTQATIVPPGEEEEKQEKEDNDESETSVVRRDDPINPWQSSHVRIEEDRFLALMDVAIKSLYNEGLRNHDVI